LKPITVGLQAVERCSRLWDASDRPRPTSRYCH